MNVSPYCNIDLEVGKVDFSNDDWIRESNDYICFRLLIECFSLPSLLFSFLHDCVMKYLYPTQSVRLLQADDFKRFPSSSHFIS